MTALIILLWCVCGTLTWAIELGYFCGLFPMFSHRKHYGIAFFVAIWGPLGLVMSTIKSNFWEYGLVWK